MKIAALIARLLLGVAFLVFGLNGFLHFIPNGPMPGGAAGQFIAALMQSHYMYVVSGLQTICGALFLANRYVPLALTLLGPVIVNILLFHILMEHTGLPIAVLVAVLWFVVFLWNKKNFSGIFEQTAS
jgi:hypothetical protein